MLFLLPIGGSPLVPPPESAERFQEVHAITVHMWRLTLCFGSCPVKLGIECAIDLPRSCWHGDRPGCPDLSVA